MLDTSAISGFLRGEEPIRDCMVSADELVVNPVVLGELKAGFVMGSAERRNRDILEQFLSSPRVRVVDIDEGTSDRYAAIVKTLRSAGRPVPTNDIWIAASAMQHGLTLLATDRHYLDVPQVLLELHEP